MDSGGTHADGYYDISPDGVTAIEAYCVNQSGRSWTVIDPSHDVDWSQFFTSWQCYGPVFGPTSASSPSYQTWAAWFELSPGASFAVSEGGTTIAQLDVDYRMTGNYYGCKWFNTNCNFNGGCQECGDPLGQLKSGTCPYRVGLAGVSYPHNCSSDWWNEGPSLGADGTHLVAYSHLVEPPVSSTVRSWSLVKARF